jgi:hypothetical protein
MDGRESENCPESPEDRPQYKANYRMEFIAVYCRTYRRIVEFTHQVGYNMSGLGLM